MSTAEQTPPNRLAALEATDIKEPPLIARQRAAVRAIRRLVAERAEAETAVEQLRASADATADAEYRRARQTLAETLELHSVTARKADETARRKAVETASAGELEAKNAFARASRRIAAEFDSVRERARSELQRDKSDAAAGFEAGEREAALKFEEARKPIDEADRTIETIHTRLATVFFDYRKFGLDAPSTTPNPETYKTDDPRDDLFDRLAKVEKPLALLEGLFIPRAMKGHRDLWLFVILFLIAIVPLASLQGPAVGAGLAVVLAVALGIAARTWLSSVAKTQVSGLYYPIFQAMVDAEALSAHCRAGAVERCKAQRVRVAQRRESELQKAKQKHAFLITTGENVRDERLREINQEYAQRLQDIQSRQKTELRASADAYERRKTEIYEQFESSTRTLEEKYRTLKEKIEGRYKTAWNDLAERWHVGMSAATAALDEVRREVDALAPPWDDPTWDDRAFSRSTPPVLRFGQVRLDLEQLPGGIPADPRLKEGVRSSFDLPALRPFPDRANLVIETPAEGRSAASGVLQAAMLRLLTGMPPGQVRFTIVDPVGIGRTFGAFMHLADFDASLVDTQVWTEPRQIEERLSELSTQIERVAQKYLRNEYATIDEYNAVAGEVAEPYRVLVVADFPAGFDEKSAARLAMIASGGVPCGVLTLVARDRDRDRALPAGFDMGEIRAGAMNLAWREGRLAWDDPDFGREPLALTLEGPPPADLATRIIQRAGAASRSARRVEVPFEFIAPAEGDWWSLDSRSGVNVPLGKAGATKRQHLTLGQGTSQHVLIAGRTGSGKSTLLHALIVNLALNYSPDEVELYLIDFKKGVEFKVYATHLLPHAAVVAIESEREFGISVLQRLDDEMRARAERFREAGVPDLNGYRNAPGTSPLPRCLLIVDEFQEFFVEEDKLAQEAALLLDRLVRQGRAFGIHILLGSQTLGGAFSLARSTLGQMAVRVALQCSEADAHLILSETNTAARMLSRPGEAVYNDANGQAEGNHFFQVVWLGEERKEEYLRQISELARNRPPVLARTPILFEGDAPADPSKNPRLRALLDAPAWPSSPRSAQAWLGDAVAIKDPTEALFRRQGGNHLLIVGQNEDSALGIMAAAMLSLAAQFPPATSDTERFGARFALLDGTPEDHPRAGELARMAAVLPHPVELGLWRDVSRVLATLAAEVERRQGPDASEGPELFLFLHDLPRFRDLRRKDDDFGFGRKEDEATPADNLKTLLREGSGFGVHVITWCDTLSNLQRVFDHQMLREFEMRVLFQMSPTDSGHLLDAPHASKLGPHRAFFSSEEQNRLEKFRPYGRLTDPWLAHVRERFHSR